MAAQLSAHGYKYYAGFSVEFVHDVLDVLGVTPADVVLDPWNGCGTSTLVAAQRGVASIGVDINPVMVVVAQGRLITATQARSAAELAQALTKQPPGRLSLRAGEPLRAWFNPRSAARVRALIDRLATSGPPSGRAPDADNAGHIASRAGDISTDQPRRPTRKDTPAGRSAVRPVEIAALSNVQAHLLTAAFLTVRSLLKPAMTSNPTWVRESLPEEDRINVTWRELTSTYLLFLGGLTPPSANPLHGPSVFEARDPSVAPTPQETPDPTCAFRQPSLLCADLTKPAQLRDLHSVDYGSSPTNAGSSQHVRPTVVFGSPPYCTRIDYAAATRPELAALGLDATAQDQLRRHMLGTTTVEPSAPSRQSWSPTADRLLADVTAHTSRASATYYRKWLAQYLDGFWNCLTNLDELTEPDAAIALVVQDSYYKDHHIDLARITIEYGASLGWTELGRFDFPVTRTMASINSKIRKYRRTFTATETLLVFATPDQGTRPPEEQA